MDGENFLVDPVPRNFRVISYVMTKCDVIRQPGIWDIRVRKPINNTLVADERKGQVRAEICRAAEKKCEGHRPGMVIGDLFSGRNGSRKHVYGWPPKPIRGNSQRKEGAAISGTRMDGVCSGGIERIKGDELTSLNTEQKPLGHRG